jgi:hypothetical protein
VRRYFGERVTGWLLKEAHQSRRCREPVRSALTISAASMRPLRTTPAVAIGIADRVWTIGDLIDAVLPLEPNRPVRVQRNFTVIDGGKND